MKTFAPVTLEDMRKAIREKEQRGDSEPEMQCRTALVLGPDFPTEVADLYCTFAFRKGVTVERIPCTDPRAKAIENGEYTGAPATVLTYSGKPQQVFLIDPEYAKAFDLVESVNFFDSKYKDGTVTAFCCKPEEVESALDWGPG